MMPIESPPADASKLPTRDPREKVEPRLFVCGICAKPIAPDTNPRFCSACLAEHTPTQGAIPEGVSKYPHIGPESLWLNERELSVWRVADIMPHRDGNGSVVLSRVDHGKPSKLAPDGILSVTQHWIHENDDYTAIDGNTANRFLAAIPWWRKALTRVQRMWVR